MPNIVKQRRTNDQERTQVKDDHAIDEASAVAPIQFSPILVQANRSMDSKMVMGGD